MVQNVGYVGELTMPTIWTSHAFAYKPLEHVIVRKDSARRSRRRSCSVTHSKADVAPIKVETSEK